MFIEHVLHVRLDTRDILLFKQGEGALQLYYRSLVYGPTMGHSADSPKEDYEEMDKHVLEEILFGSNRAVDCLGKSIQSWSLRRPWLHLPGDTELSQHECSEAGNRERANEDSLERN